MTEATAWAGALQLSRCPRLRVEALDLAWYSDDQPPWPQLDASQALGPADEVVTVQPSLRSSPSGPGQKSQLYQKEQNKPATIRILELGGGGKGTSQRMTSAEATWRPGHLVRGWTRGW